MFREMRRSRQQLSNEECIKILQTEKRAAFSVIGEDGYPYTVPINFIYDANENRIYFHGAKTGHKFDAIRRCDRVCLTTWNQGFKEDGHWEYTVTSVVVFGRVKLVTDDELAQDRLRSLAEKYYPSTDQIKKGMQSPSIDRVQVLEIIIEHMTGKLVKEK